MVTKLIIPKPPKILLPHHSSSDWDKSGTQWRITSLNYISPPSSLIFPKDATTNFMMLLCRNAAVNKMPEGRIVAYTSIGHATYYASLYFRNIADLGLSNRNNTYQVSFKPTGPWSVTERIGGGIIRTWTSLAPDVPTATWFQHRLTWWLDWAVLIVTWEVKVNDTWIQQGDIISIETPLFGAEDLQRVGLGCGTASVPYPHYWDDYEVWEKP